MADIFISYARPDQKFARTLASALEGLGWSVWWDPNLIPGEQFDEVIEAQLESASCVIVVWSQVSVARRWVRAEARFADERGVLIPIRLDDALPSIQFRDIQTASFAGWSGDVAAPQFEALITAVERLAPSSRRTRAPGFVEEAPPSDAASITNPNDVRRSDAGQRVAAQRDARQDETKRDRDPIGEDRSGGEDESGRRSRLGGWVVGGSALAALIAAVIFVATRPSQPPTPTNEPSAAARLVPTVVPSVTRLRVDTETPGTVFWGGEKLGPSGRAYEIEPGSEAVAVESDGYARYEQRLTVEAGETRLLEIELDPLPPARAVVIVRSNVAGDRVSIGGREVGRSGLGGHRVDPDVPIDVRVEKDGYTGFAATIKLRPGEERTITARLTPVRPAPKRADSEPKPVEAKVLRPRMVSIPGGAFTMGSPASEVGRDADEREQRVTVSGFSVSETEITQGQYEGVVGSNPATDCNGIDLGPDLPVVCVSWFDAVGYCNLLSEAEGLDPTYALTGVQVTWNRGARGYRLLTEAEWEYAARAGQQARFVGTSDEAEACRWGNVDDRTVPMPFPGSTFFTCDDRFERLAPVHAVFPANAFELRGMGGNVSEWVWDWYVTEYGEMERDPAGPATGSVRVFRGASWYASPQASRVANRDSVEPSRRNAILGFRIARSASD